MRRTLFIDAAALLVYAAAALPALTGVPVHEWLGLALLVPVLVHCVLHADWVATTLVRLGRGAGPARVGHLALDAALLVAFMVVLVSGLGISGTVLQAFGLYVDGYYAWGPLHAIAAKALLALLLVHVAVHAGSLYNLLKRRGASKAPAHDDGGLSDEHRSA